MLPDVLDIVIEPVGAFHIGKGHCGGIEHDAGDTGGTEAGKDLAVRPLRRMLRAGEGDAGGFDHSEGSGNSDLAAGHREGKAAVVQILHSHFTVADVRNGNGFDLVTVGGVDSESHTLASRGIAGVGNHFAVVGLLHSDIVGIWIVLIQPDALGKLHILTVINDLNRILIYIAGYMFSDRKTYRNVCACILFNQVLKIFRQNYRRHFPVCIVREFRQDIVASGLQIGVGGRHISVLAGALILAVFPYKRMVVVLCGGSGGVVSFCGQSQTGQQRQRQAERQENCQKSFFHTFLLTS